MAAARRGASKRREVAVLALGLASAALLVAAALAPFSDPAVAGRAAFAQLAGRVLDGVLDEWERSLRDPGAPVGDERGAWLWDADALSRAHALVDEPDELVAGVEDSAFEVLLAEALRTERAGDPAAALAAAREAALKPAAPARLAAARLLALRTAVAVGERAAAREQWAAAERELDGRERLDGGPALLLCALAAAPALTPDECTEGQTRLVRLWSSAGLALPPEGAQLELGASSARRAPTPRRDVLCEGLQALAPAGDLSAVREYENLRALRALESALEALPARPADERWHLQAWRRAVLAVRARGTQDVEARLGSAVELAAGLAVRVTERALLPADFTLDFDGEGAGQEVLPRQVLLEPLLGVSLRHGDPERAARSQTARLSLLRTALLVVAGLSAAAALTTFAALRRSRRLSELKTSFVANVSHELRTPLASILMLADNLAEGRVPDEAGRARYHGLIRREAGRLRRLVDDLLDFARLERGAGLELTREPLELDEFARDLAAEASAWAARSEVQLDVRLAHCPGSAGLDAEALGRAVLNLLENARRHSGSPAVRLDVGVREGALVLAVEDPGRGVPAEAAARIFQPFERIEGAGSASGTGLGLAIVREIAAAHGGTVRHRVPSSGRGARFELHLPLEPPA